MRKSGPAGADAHAGRHTRMQIPERSAEVAIINQLGATALMLQSHPPRAYPHAESYCRNTNSQSSIISFKKNREGPAEGRRERTREVKKAERERDDFTQFSLIQLETLPTAGTSTAYGYLSVRKPASQPFTQPVNYKQMQICVRAPTHTGARSKHRYATVPVAAR